MSTSPACFEPVVLVPCADPFDDPDWVFEPRYEGIRALLHATDEGCELHPRIALAPDRIQELQQRIAGVLRARDAILDGAIVTQDGGLPAFAAFDLLQLDGRDLRGLPLDQRKRALAELLPRDTGPLYKVLTIDECGRALFQAAKRLDLAGIVAKRKSDSYGPNTRWYRIENRQRGSEKVGPSSRPSRVNSPSFRPSRQSSRTAGTS